MSYQGELKKDGLPYTGVAQMKFAILDGTNQSLWSNDGTGIGGSEPTTLIDVTATNGIFAVRLGAPPMDPITGDLLKGVTEAALRVWVNTGEGFEQLTDQPISSGAFALSSEKVEEVGSLVTNAVPRWNGLSLSTSALFAKDNGYVGIGTANPTAPLHIIGDFDAQGLRLDNAAIIFGPGSAPVPDQADLVFYRGGTGFGILRRYGPDYTILKICSPPVSLGAQEATLALVRGDEPNQEFLDLYNNGYLGGEQQFGLRMQKRGTGEFRDFVFDYSDGVPPNDEVMRLKPTGEVGIGTATPTAKLDVAGTVKSSIGGFEFPDGTVQTTAVQGGGAGVPSGAMILTISQSSPIGFSFTGMSLDTSGTNIWYKRNPLPQPLTSFALVPAAGKIYAIGAPSGAVYEYSPTTGHWAPRMSLPYGRIFIQGVNINDQVYIFGGFGNSGSPYPIMRYDPGIDSWSSLAPIPTGVYNHSAAVAGGKIYAIGGKQESTGAVSSLVQEYDPASDTWTLRAAMPTARYSAAAATIGDEIFVAGGHDQFGALSVIEAFNPSTNSWTTKPDLPYPRYDFTAVSVNNKIYYLGGCTAQQCTASYVDVFSLNASSWSVAPPMPTGRCNLAAAVLNGAIYAAGGGNSGPTTTDAFEEYVLPVSMYVHQRD